MTRSRDVAASLSRDFVRGEPQFAKEYARSTWPYEDDLNSMIAWMRKTILDSVTFQDPSQREVLLPENLVLRAGTPRLRNALNIVAADGSSLIVFGEGLYTLLRAFVKTAATYFVPVEDGAPKPSQAWPAAREAMARLFDQFSVPFETFDEPQITLGIRQQRVAEVFTGYTVRFVLCHEMAHVLCGHLNSDAISHGRIGAREVDVLRAKQESEMQADAIGLDLHVRSITDPGMHEGALASAMYFISSVYLLTFRLDILSELVDDLKAWEITEVPLDHPPVLARVMAILSSANRFQRGIALTLDRLRQDLFDVVHAVIETVREQQQIAITATTAALQNVSSSSEKAVHAAISANFTTSRSGVLVALKRAILDGSEFAATLVRETLPEARAFFERYSPGLL